MVTPGPIKPWKRQGSVAIRATALRRKATKPHKSWAKRAHAKSGGVAPGPEVKTFCLLSTPAATEYPVGYSATNGLVRFSWPVVVTGPWPG
jgi:hypothetical protein